MPQKRQFDFLTPGDHVCLIYHTDKERFYSGILFILDGLKKGEMVVVIDDDIKDLLSEFIDVEFSLAKGQLVFMDARECDFDYRRLISKLKEVESEVAEKGFKGFRYLINFDPTAEENILDYESQLVQWSRGIALCMFDGEKFGYDTLARLLVIHPKLIIRKKTVENFFYPFQSNFILGKEIRENDYFLLVKRIVELHETIREFDRLRERYLAICNTLQDGVFTLKGDTFVEANSKFRKMLGLSHPEILGKKIHDLSPREQPDGEESRAKATKITTIAAEKGKFFFKWRFKGRDRFIDTEISLGRFKLNGEYHLIGIVRNVTEGTVEGFEE
jgi:PAS domain S-box-containing protein